MQVEGGTQSVEWVVCGPGVVKEEDQAKFTGVVKEEDSVGR